MVTPTSVMVTLHANLYNSGHIFQSLIHFILLSTMCALNIIKLSLLFSSNGEVAMEFTQSRVLNTSNDSWQCFVSTIKYNPVNSITFGNLFMTLGETSYFQRTTTCYEKMKKKRRRKKEYWLQLFVPAKISQAFLPIYLQGNAVNSISFRTSAKF